MHIANLGPTSVASALVIAVGLYPGAEASPPSEPAVIPPNIVLIVLDDLGCDKLSFYSPSTTAITPFMDALQTSGILFTAAYANPVCSPSRACIQTGRYGNRTGMLTYIASGVNNEFTLPPTVDMLAARLVSAHYQTAAFGKWHLARDDDPLKSNEHPCQCGFQEFHGHIANNDNTTTPGANGHWGWRLVDDTSPAVSTAVESGSTQWDARVTTNNATTWMTSQTSPFFAYVAYNPPHAAFQLPQLDLTGGGAIVNISPQTYSALGSAGLLQPPYTTLHASVVGLSPCGFSSPGAPTPAELATYNAIRLVYQANIEAIDYEISQLWGSLAPPVRDNTIFIIVGDNGTVAETLDELYVPPDVAPHGGWTCSCCTPSTVCPVVCGTPPTYTAGPGYPAFHGKKFLYELGTHVPLIVSLPPGPPYLTGQYTGLVGVVDLWRTILDCAGAPLPPLGAPQDESKSFKPVFTNLSHVVRSMAYCEIATRNGYAFTGPACTASPGWVEVITGQSFSPASLGLRRTVTDGHYKYIRNSYPHISTSICCRTDFCTLLAAPYGGSEELYDLLADPNELNNLMCSPPLGVLTPLKREMCRISGGVQ